MLKLDRGLQTFYQPFEVTFRGGNSQQLLNRHGSPFFCPGTPSELGPTPAEPRPDRRHRRATSRIRRSGPGQVKIFIDFSWTAGD